MSSYNSETAYQLLKARLDRGGLTVPAAQEDYWRRQAQAAAERIAARGISLTGSMEDSLLVADYAAYNITNRDERTGEPEWFRYALRVRWLKQNRTESE